MKSQAEILDAVKKAVEAYEAIPFKDLAFALAEKNGPRFVDAMRPQLVRSNQMLRVILDALQ